MCLVSLPENVKETFNSSFHESSSKQTKYRLYGQKVKTDRIIARQSENEMCQKKSNGTTMVLYLELHWEKSPNG